MRTLLAIATLVALASAAQAQGWVEERPVHRQGWVVDRWRNQ